MNVASSLEAFTPTPPPPENPETSAPWRAGGCGWGRWRRGGGGREGGGQEVLQRAGDEVVLHDHPRHEGEAHALPRRHQQQGLVAARHHWIEADLAVAHNEA